MIPPPPKHLRFLGLVGMIDPLRAGAKEAMFKPFGQVGSDRSGLGLGLSIALKSVEADGGKLSVQDLPGRGCIFSIDLPRAPLR